MNPLDAAITGASTNAPMTDPKNPEAQNEELDLEELKGAAGGVGGLSGPGGTTFLKQNVGGSADPGGTSY